MPGLRCWRAGIAAASLCLLGARQAAGEPCVDQDDRWKAHGSDCKKMKRLCDDKGYGALVRKWCPRSCGLCVVEEAAAVEEAPATPPADEAVAVAAPEPQPQPEPEHTVADSDPELADNTTWEVVVHVNTSVASGAGTTTTTAAGGTTTTTASVAPGTTTTTEALQPEANLTANGTCEAEAPAALSEATEAPLLYRYTAGPEALLPPGGAALEIEGGRLLELGPLDSQASVVQAIINASALAKQGYNTTTTSTPWDFIAPPEQTSLQAVVEAENASHANASSQQLGLRAGHRGLLHLEAAHAVDVGAAQERLDGGAMREAISELDAVLRGKRARHRGQRHPRPARGRGSAGPRGREEGALWIGDGDALAGDNATEALLLGGPSGNASDASGKKAAAGLQEKALPRPAATEVEEEERDCPEGYERVVGDVYGADQFSGSRNNYAESKKECGQRCSRTPGCGSFEYSPSRKQCYRNSQTRPTHNKDRGDFVFCRRAPCPSFKTQEACVGPSVAADFYSAELSLRPGSYCIWSGGACQAPMACTDKDCFLPDGGLPGMELPSWQTLWISRTGLEATMRKAAFVR